MNRRLSSILFVAFVIAAVSSYLVYRVAGKQMQPQQQQVTSQILVAAHDLELGAVIKDADVSTAEWVGPLPKTAIAHQEGVGDSAAALLSATVSG